MPKIKLTHRGIGALKPKGEWLTDYWDSTLPGFGVRAHPTGRKAYFVRYRGEDGKRRRQTLGTYPTLSLTEARDRARDLIGRIARGADPMAEKKAHDRSETFAELADEYLERHAKLKKKRWKDDEQAIRRDLLPAWGKLKAKDVSRRDVTKLLDKIVERGAPIMANRTKALISKIFNFGIGRDIVEINPCVGVPMPAKSRQRDRVLSDDELRAFWSALDALAPVMSATFRMRLITAQRGVEVGSMRWTDIDGDWWTIPGEISKNGLAHRVPLSPPALELLELLRPLTGHSEWVFESRRKPGQPTRSFQKAAERASSIAGIEDFVPHDLRRTAASGMTSAGVPRLVVSKILNHVEGGVTAIYDRHGYDREKRDALNLWAEKLENILRSESCR